MRDSIERVVEQTKRTNEAHEGSLRDPQYMAFGDSVLFLWQLDEESRFLPYVGMAIADVFVDCLEKGIALRGAVSFGHVCYDDQVAVGPAVSDAADWYEQADALAILVTPRTGLLVDMYRLQSADLIDRAFARYEFKLKSSNEKREMWALSWPPELRERANKAGVADRDIRPQLLSTLYQRFVMPKGTDMKYEEALLFFDKCAEGWKEQT